MKKTAGKCFSMNEAWEKAASKDEERYESRRKTSICSGHFLLALFFDGVRR